MCIVFFIKNSKDYKLIIAGNRDEFLSRPSTRSHFWSHCPDIGILAGMDAKDSKDAKDVGTWMGISRKGDFSFLTNKRTDPLHISKDKKSRGLLVSNFLWTGNPKEYLKNVDPKEYNGYFLVIGNVNDQMYLSSNDDHDLIHPLELNDNTVYGLSNGSFIKSNWPKVENGKNKFTEILQEQDRTKLIQKLFNLLKDNTFPTPDQMPEPIFNKEIEDMLSCICVDCVIGEQRYATRTHTVILVDYQDNVYFEEIDRYQTNGDSSLKYEFELHP